MIDGLALALFRRHELRSSDDIARPCHTIDSNGQSQSEIRSAGPTVAVVDQHVRRLDVPMNDAPTMCCRQPLSHISRQPHDISHRQPLITGSL